MYKDIKIMNSLERLSQSIILSDGILNDAVTELRARKQHGKVIKRRLSFAQIIPIAAVIVFIVLGGLLFNNLMKGSDNFESYYRITDLSKQQIELSEIDNYTDETVLTLDYSEMNSQCTAYYENDELMLIEISYLVVNDNGTDKVTLYADLGQRLYDYRAYRDYNIEYEDEIDVRAYQYYDNGEYYTKAYFEAEGVDYYILIMSPNSGQGERYYENLTDSLGG